MPCRVFTFYFYAVDRHYIFDRLLTAPKPHRLTQLTPPPTLQGVTVTLQYSSMYSVNPERPKSVPEVECLGPYDRTLDDLSNLDSRSLNTRVCVVIWDHKLPARGQVNFGFSLS